MTIGQKFTVYVGTRGVGTRANKGNIVAAEDRYVVVQFKNYRESFLKVDIENNLERDFELG